MRILGIDPGTAKLGYGIIEKSKIKNQKSKIIEYGCLTTKPDLIPGDRLLQLYQGLCVIIKKSQPDVMAVEELFFFKNLKTAIKVAEARGVTVLAARKNQIEVREYTPLQVKQSIVGYGRADKQQVQKMVKVLLKLDKIPKPDDAADALAVALTCAYTKKFDSVHPNHSNFPRISPEGFTNHPNHSNFPRISPEEFTKTKLVYPELSYQIVGVLQSVSNTAQFKLNERYYYPLIEKELHNRNIHFAKQLPIELNLPFIKGRYFIDYVIEDKILLEIKVGSRIKKKDTDQIMAYLRATRKQLAILARFTREGVSTKRFLLGYKNHPNHPNKSRISLK